MVDEAFMADATVLKCPKCDKKFKARAGQEGKKIRCPHCERAFVVDEAIAAAKPQAKAAAKGPPPAPSAPAKPPEPPKQETATHFGFEEDEGPNRYEVTPTEIQARCPNCANPLRSERDVICTFCGYNTQTRVLGKTEKLEAHTPGEVFMHLLPGLVCIWFIVSETIGMLYYCLVLPFTLEGESWMSMVDHESMRMWTVIISLFNIWPAGMFAFHRLVLNPVPPKKVKD
jgi:DNA-directed RNA polymerase subunit RPC12/RpoP